MAPRRRRVALVAVSVVGVVATGSCGAQETLGRPPSTVVVSEVVTTVTRAPHSQGGVEVPAAPAQSAPPTDSGAPVGAGLEHVVAGETGPVGVAVEPVGGGARPVTAGAWRSGVAWSTIKVPLAIAAEQSGSGALEGAEAAITASDNAEAERLWAALGGGSSSSSAVQSVLTQAGDHATRVPSTATRPPFSVFGQTRWSLADQAGFAAALPCLDGSVRVVDLMGRVSPEQSWGLGTIAGARVKGGWGPREDDGYLVRQFGLVPGAGGELAVAIAVDAPTFEAGTAALSRLAGALTPVLAETAGGAC